METRKESICELKMCRFCLNRNESLTSMYEGTKAPKSAVPLSLKILFCVGIEIFPSDKKLQYICNRCKFFMDLSYAFKQICRQADERIHQYIQNGTQLDPVNWPSTLKKVFRSINKPGEVGVVETVVQSGATVKVMAEEVSESDDGDDEDVYNVKIGDGPEEGKRIKVVGDIKEAPNKRNRKDSDDSERVAAAAGVQHGCWPCDECECTYPLEQLLSLHKAQKHRARQIECDECDAKFFSKCDLYVHQLTHSDEMPFECVACGKKFKRLILLKRHEKLMHSDIPQLQCPHCPAKFLSTEELDAHQQRHDKYLSRPYVCSVCNKRFHSSLVLKKHFDNMHSKKAAFSCQYCPEQFPTVSKLTRHVREHAGERPYPCKHCDKSFTKSHHYTRHLRLKHSSQIRSANVPAVETERYRCEECEETFTCQDDLIYHSALHATTNLVCPLCQEKFDDVDTVTAHIKSHVNGTEFMCDFCELIFTSKVKLENHIANVHDDELLSNEQDMDENSMEMDAEEDEDDNSINVTEEDGHMVVQINKADDYMLPTQAEEDDDDKQDNTQSEDSEIEEQLLTKTDDEPVKPPIQVTENVAAKVPSVAIQKLPEVASKTEQVVASAEVKLADSSEKQISAILKKVDEAQKVAQQAPSIIDKEEKIAEKKEKPNKVVTVTATPGASEKSLRLLEKELQELKRTSRSENKTPSKPIEALRNKRPQIHTSTPKTRAIEKKEVQGTKTSIEKYLVEKKAPERVERRVVTKENKEPKDLKEATVKETEEKVKDEEPKEDKKENKDKETTKALVKNGVADKSSLDDSVRRSTRPSKVKDYAKMIRDASSSDDDSDDENVEDDTKEDKSIRLRGRPRKKPTETQSPAVSTGPKKRGRPRKDRISDVPAKIKKGDSSDDEVKKDARDEKYENKDKCEANKSESQEKTTEPSTPPKENKADQSKPPSEPNPNVLVSPNLQTLKRVPVKALPPGVKPLPLPRNMAAGEVCEMQIGKKVVKVQKIVMTKAEVEAMAKKGLVEMKDGTMVLKQGIKLPATTDPNVLRASLQAETDKKPESPKKD